MKWSRASVLPRVSPRPKRGGLLSSSRADTLCRSKNGGLCGHCSRDLPLDRRLLFVAELTGRKMVGCVGNAPTLVQWTSALQAARDLYAATNPKWLRDVESHHDRGAYEAPLVLNLPAI